MVVIRVTMAQASVLIPSLQSELVCIPLEAYVDLLAGISWSDFSEKWRQDAKSPLPQDTVEILKSSFSAPQQYLLSDEEGPDSEGAASLCPLEILWLKWLVFSELSNQLIAFEEQHNRPYLNLSPECIDIKMPAKPSPMLPARWPVQLDLDLTHRAQAFSSKLIPTALSKHLFLPAKKALTLYHSPAIQNQHFGQVIEGVVSVRKVEKWQDAEEKNEGQIRGIVSFHFVAEGLQNTLVSENDLFFTQLSVQDETKPTIEIWATEAQTLEKGLLLKGTTNSMAAESWEYFNAAQTRVFSQASLTHYPAYAQSSDLYSLGMILFHLLLVNASHNIEDINDTLQALIPRIPPMVQGLGPEDQQILCKRFDSLLSEYGALFSKSAVFYMHASQKTRLPEIPDALWMEALIIGFRLITDIPGFSFGGKELSAPRSDTQPFSIETLRPQLSAMKNRLKQALFESRSRRSEIEAVCDLLRTEQIAEATQNNGL